MSESSRRRAGFWVVGLVVVCFGLGLAVGIGLLRGDGKGLQEDEGGLFSGKPGISAMVTRVVVDEDAHRIFARLVGAGREDFVRELGKLPEWDGSSPSVRAKWMALAIRWVLEDAEEGAGFLMEHREDAPLNPFAKLFREVWAKQDLAGASAFAERIAASGHEVSWWMKVDCEVARREADPDGFLRGLPTEDYYERRNEIEAAIARLATTSRERRRPFSRKWETVRNAGRRWSSWDTSGRGTIRRRRNRGRLGWRMNGNAI